MLPLAALPPPLASLETIALSDAGAERRAADGRHALLTGAPHQLWLTGDPAPGTPLGVLIPLDEALPKRLFAALSLWRLLRGRRAGTVEALSHQRRQRLVLGLRALDGRAEGASYRELARGLFGPASVPDGPAWKTHDLRSRTMRLVADATALRDGGYRALLRTAPGLKLRR